MKNILIVDDEETILVTLVEWFASAHSDWNFNILTATNGIEAIKSLAANKVDLLITDLNMPKMDGFELLSHVMNDYKNLPIIIISAFATPEIKDKVRNMGATLFIPKPFSFDDLEDINFKDIVDPPKADKSEGKGYVNGISLQSFLQLINIEGKTATLTIKSEGKTGTISVKQGELMNAKTGNLEGGKAAQEIISWSDEGLTIEIENVCHDTEKKFNLTIMGLLMEAARMADEKAAKASGVKDDDAAASQVVKEVTADAIRAQQAKDNPPPPPTPPPASQPAAAPVAAAPKKVSQPMKQKKLEVDLSKLDLMMVQTKLKEFSALDGFAGAVLSTINGEILQVVTSKGSKVNLEQAAIFSNNILSTSHSSTMNMKMGSGGSNLVQLDNEAGHMLIAGRGGLNILLILAVSSSLGLGKIMVSRTLDDITSNMI